MERRERALGQRVAVVVRDWRVPLAYAALVLGTYLLALLVGTVQTGSPTVATAIVDPFLFPVLFFLVPPVIAAVNAAVGGGVPQSVAVGLVPALSFPVMVGIGRLVGIGAGADAPLWALVLVYALLGLVGAGFGVVVGRGIRRLTAG